MVAQTQTPTLHIRFQGRSFDLLLSDLDIGDRSSDGDVKQSLADYLEVPAAHLRDYRVDRHETGNLTIRPEAVYG